MKRVLPLLCVLLTFTFASWAQSSSSTKSSSKKAAGKMHQLTGCVSQTANPDGNYTLTNGHFKKGVELLGETSEIQAQAGHEVRVMGNWTTAAAEGGTSKSMSANEKNEKHFEVSQVKLVSDTCPAPGAMAHHHTKTKGTSGTANPGR
jgi:hypothetical protein